VVFSKENNKKPKYKYQNKDKSSIYQAHTILYVSKKTGKTHLFRIPGIVPPLIILFTSTIITVAITMTINYINTKKAALELEHIRDESLGLQSEVEALHTKMKNIENTVNQVTYYSEKIKKVTTRTDDRKLGTNYKNQDQNKSIEQNGIGPLTKEEFDLSNKLTGLKYESLELKTLFDLAQESEFKTSIQLEDLKKFLVDAQKAALKLQSIPDIAPVRGRLTSTFGWRVSPFNGHGRIHWGVDIAAPPGTPIFATANGTVIRVTQSDDYGKFVEIIHEKKMITRYAHTSAIYVKEGAIVKKGDVIAAVGNTGHSTGPHIHYEIDVNGKRYDPENFIILW
jgi:murein DD-endopeptidase MepM/ murein hydrolase activator NlpD